jgi:putative Holliday junction resolvase
MSDETRPAGVPDQSAIHKLQSAISTSGRLLGLDFGTKRVGVAISDFEQRYAAPLAMIPRSSAKGDAVALLRLAEENAAVGLVVGLPVHMSGDEGTKAKQAREFGTWAGRTAGLPVAYWDERHSSTIAEGRLLGAGMSEKKRKAKLDALAAQIMLQSYLDAPDRTRWTARRPPRRPAPG